MNQKQRYPAAVLGGQMHSQRPINARNADQKLQYTGARARGRVLAARNAICAFACHFFAVGCGTIVFASVLGGYFSPHWSRLLSPCHSRSKDPTRQRKVPVFGRVVAASMRDERSECSKMARLRNEGAKYHVADWPGNEVETGDRKSKGRICLHQVGKKQGWRKKKVSEADTVTSWAFEAKVTCLSITVLK